MRENAPFDAAERFLNSLSRPTRLLAAVSGGSDSTGLLLALKQALDTGKYSHSLTAATIDHALRIESAAEARAVTEMCDRLGIPHRTLVWTGEKPATGLSSAARDARYRLLAEAAAASGADLLVTGHTADDQQETIAMRAARAQSDNLGLAGMAEATLYDRRLWIFRPFLGVSRSAIRAWLSGQQVGWIDDPSNTDPHYERVRIRHRLDGNQKFDPHVAGAGRRALSDATAALIDSCAICHAGALIRLAPGVRKADPALLRHTLATLVAIAGGRSHRPASDAMDRLMTLTISDLPGRMTLSRTLVVSRTDGIYLTREARDILTLTIEPHSAGIWDGRFLVANQSDEARIIEAGASPRSADRQMRLTAGQLRHLARVLPQIAAPGSKEREASEAAHRCSVEPTFPLFDRFLPDFDLQLAKAVARLFGRKAYMPTPV